MFATCKLEKGGGQRRGVHVLGPLLKARSSAPLPQCLMPRSPARGACLAPSPPARSQEKTGSRIYFSKVSNNFLCQWGGGGGGAVLGPATCRPGKNPVLGEGRRGEEASQFLATSQCDFGSIISRS